LLVIWWGAKALLVNDELTRNEIARWMKKSVYTVPFPVDPLFFQFSKAGRTRGMIVVPGDNDRDEEVVVRLARSGWRIVRVTRADEVRAYYERLKSRVHVEVKFRVPYGELRELYQTAEVVAMPLKCGNHAAGQTAVLEAVVSGVPVVLSAGRTASIVKYLESVLVCDTNEVNAWCSALRRAAKLHLDGGRVIELSARLVAEQHSPEAVGHALIAILDRVCGGKAEERKEP
jgi:glycosyltransferase involved in cell wall biosynthesis